MRALYFDGKGFSLKDLPRPEPGPGEALAHVEVAGVCRTDLEIAKGYMGFTGVPGHEFAGTVEECADTGWIGRRVTGEINLPCGACSYCKVAMPRHCPNRTVLGIAGKNGAFAEYLTLPVANLHPLPDILSTEAAVFVEPVAACFEILEQVPLEGRRVAVIGDGKLGILAARVIKAAGPSELVLAGKHPEKLSLLKPDNIKTALIVEFLSSARAPDKKFDVAVEATGRAGGFQAALSCVSPRGTIVQKSTVAGKVEIDLARVVVDEITVVGSRCGPFEPALKALAEGSVRVEDMITASFPLEKGLEALERAAEPGALKVLIYP